MLITGDDLTQCPIRAQTGPSRARVARVELSEIDRPTSRSLRQYSRLAPALRPRSPYDLNEASTEVHDFLEFDADAGPLSGKTILAVIACFASWSFSTCSGGGQNPTLRSVVIAKAVLDRPRRARNVLDVLPGVCV